MGAGTLAAGLAVGLVGCTSPGGEHDRMMAERGVAGASRESFTLCHGHGCRLRSQIGFSDVEWALVADLFAVPAASAAEERDRIAIAIGLLETAAGRKAGTSRDVGGTLNAFGVSSGGTTGFDDQFDCFDETTNTSTYLSLLAQAGFLNWHRIEGWAGRGSVIGGGGWPHQTAVIAELQSGRAYAVDSWFEDNGHPAHMVSLDAWYAEWVPPGFVDTPF
ncbi:MAG: hypothetical protein ACM35H_03195 [Bacteroidota bacterium]|nr:hypothetical protein [Kiloniellaceae bacterium]